MRRCFLNLWKLLPADFPGGPVVNKTPRFHCRGAGSVPCWGTRAHVLCSSAKKSQLLIFYLLDLSCGKTAEITGDCCTKSRQQVSQWGRMRLLWRVWSLLWARGPWRKSLCASPLPRWPRGGTWGMLSLGGCSRPSGLARGFHMCQQSHDTVPTPPLHVFALRVTQSLCSGRKSWQRHSRRPSGCYGEPPSSSTNPAQLSWNSQSHLSATGTAMASEPLTYGEGPRRKHLLWAVHVGCSVLRVQPWGKMWGWGMELLPSGVLCGWAGARTPRCFY